MSGVTLKIEPISVVKASETIPFPTQPFIPIEFRVHVRRPDDFLVFDLIFTNLKLDNSSPPNLIRKDPNLDAYIMVEFPPQSFGEQAFEETEPISNTLPCSKIRMSGVSRLVFLMPKTENSLPYLLKNILGALCYWSMVLDNTAVPELDISTIKIGEAFVSKFSNSWLIEKAKSENLTKMLSDSFNSFSANKNSLETAFSEAAGRVIKESVEQVTSGKTDNLNEALTNQLLIEFEGLSRLFPELKDEKKRQAGLNALTTSTIQGLANSGLTLNPKTANIVNVPLFQILIEPHEPTYQVTALEIPYRLILSPIGLSRWLHQTLPVNHNNRIELWHTRLRSTINDLIANVRTDSGPDGETKVRAIWSPDYLVGEGIVKVGPPYPQMYQKKPFLMSLSASDRSKLVKDMAGFTEQVAGILWKPKAAHVRRFHLSALGSLLDVNGNWNPPSPTDLVEWTHRGTLGRDQYVKVVYSGYLCPFGHAAVYTKITERKFESIGNNPSNRVAVLRQRYYVTVREPVKQYDGSRHIYHGNNFPFRSVEITTLTTPDIVPPQSAACQLKGVAAIQDVFWPQISENNCFNFPIIATDMNGNRIAFSMPLLFVGYDSDKIKNNIDSILKAYGSDDPDIRARRLADTSNAKVCFAERIVDPSADAVPNGDPQMPAKNILFKAEAIYDQDFDMTGILPNFYPEIQTATVGLPAVQKLLKKPDAEIEMKYTNEYRDNKFDKNSNPAEVFFQVVGQTLDLNFGEAANDLKNDGVGALASPQMKIEGLSRLIGAAGDLSGIKSGSFNPEKFFGDAKLFGGLTLADILDSSIKFLDDNKKTVPHFTSQEFSDHVEARYKWTIDITHSDPFNLIVPQADTSLPCSLDIDANIKVPYQNAEQTDYNATAELGNFKLNFFGFIIIWVDDIKFVSKKQKKADISLSLHNKGDSAVEFGGPLEFINTLRSFIPTSGFSDPPEIQVTPSGIVAGYKLELPVINVGYVVISNVSLGAKAILPFDSKPMMVDFMFCERQHPFRVTVSALGGGGFFALGVTSAGVQEIEAALEFAASVSIDLGVASGGAEVKAGIYFHWLDVQGLCSVELTGFVRIHGELSVLGLISASLTFNLQLAYEKDGQDSKVWGEASLQVSIDLWLFSIDVSVKCRKEFYGSHNSDPKFTDLIPDENTWNDYCKAFAEETVN